MAKYIIELDSDDPTADILVRVICEEVSRSLVVMDLVTNICAFKDDGSVLLSDGDLIYG